MNLKHAHIAWVLGFFLLLIGSCKKAEMPVLGVAPENVTLYDDTDVLWALGAVAGNGVVLLVYIDKQNDYQFKLMNNEGTEIWKKTFGYNNAQLQIIYDLDDTFAIFNGVGLTKIDLQGQVVFSDSLFLKGNINNLESFSIEEIVLGNNDNYLIMGSGQLSGNRAFVGEYSRSGDQNFFKLFTVNVTGYNAYTSGFKNESGGYTLAGSFASYTGGLNSEFFLTKLAADGFIIETKRTEVDSLRCYGKELLELKNGNLAYLLSPIDQNSSDPRSRVYRINAQGEIVSVAYLDLAVENYGAGGGLYFGKGMVQNTDGSFSGIMNTTLFEINPYILLDYFSTYVQPHYSYSYALGNDASVISQDFINRNYSNYYNSIVRLSNGKTMLFGTTLSFGEEMKLTTMVL